MPRKLTTYSLTLAVIDHDNYWTAMLPYGTNVGQGKTAEEALKSLFSYREAWTELPEALMLDPANRHFESVEQFLRTYFAWIKSLAETQATRFISECSLQPKDIQEHWLCCAYHRILKSQLMLFMAWSRHFGRKYDMKQKYAGQEVSPGWIIELAQKAGFTIPEDQASQDVLMVLQQQN